MFHVKHSTPYELVIRKSRFLSQALFVSDDSEISHLLQEARSSHPQSNHICHAFRLIRGSREDVGYSDDGEPHGTAGRPILSLLQHEDVGNALIYVVRYFGGIKLGTGGLVRAYTDAAKGAVNATTLELFVERVRTCLDVPYQLHQPLMGVIADYGVSVVTEEFGTSVTLVCDVDKVIWDEWVQAIRDCTRGTVDPQADV